MISEQLRTTLLSLKQISDRLKLLNTTSVTKSEALAYKNEIIAALEDIDFTEITEDLDSIDDKIDDISTELEDVAKQGSDPTATNTELKNLILQLGIILGNEYAQNINEIIGDWSNE